VVVFGGTSLKVISLIMRAKQYKFQSIIWHFFAVRTAYDYIIILFTAGFAKQINDYEIFLYRTGIKSLKVAFKRLPDG
jgi:hypothetical protein